MRSDLGFSPSPGDVDGYERMVKVLLALAFVGDEVGMG